MRAAPFPVFPRPESPATPRAVSARFRVSQGGGQFSISGKKRFHLTTWFNSFVNITAGGFRRRGAKKTARQDCRLNDALTVSGDVGMAAFVVRTHRTPALPESIAGITWRGHGLGGCAKAKVSKKPSSRMRSDHLRRCRPASRLALAGGGAFFFLGGGDFPPPAGGKSNGPAIFG